MVRRRERMTVRLWDIQIAPNPWFSIALAWMRRRRGRMPSCRWVIR